MRTPLRQRLGFANRSAEARADRGKMARALMYTFAAGGTIALATLSGATGESIIRARLAAAVAFGAAGGRLAPGRGRPRRSGQPLSLLVGDLDHFKELNDRFGHATGDRALEQLSLILRTAKRRIDTAARVGGEEFAVILPDSDQHAAQILAERMRREVRETFMYEPFDLTISLGVATFPLHSASSEDLFAQADEALYAAKALGRDRTVVYNDDLAADVAGATGKATPRSERPTATVPALPDGTGSPKGLAGHDIPLEARILAVADAYQAMTSDRVYRAAKSPEEAREELLRCAGTQFDRLVVDAFLRVLDAPSEARGLKLEHQPVE